MGIENSVVKKIDDGMTHECLILNKWLVIAKNTFTHFKVADPSAPAVITDLCAEEGEIKCEGGTGTRKIFQNFKGKVVVI